MDLLEQILISFSGRNLGQSIQSGGNLVILNPNSSN